MSHPASAARSWRSGILLAVGLLTTSAAVGVFLLVVKADFLRQSRLINVSCRGLAGAGGEAMVAGFVIADHPQTVVVRALGPSLASQGVANPLQNPRLRIVRNNTGAELARNEGWRAPENERLWGDLIPYAPADPRDAVCVMTLPAGAYSAVIEPRSGAAGTAMVEIFVIVD